MTQALRIAPMSRADLDVAVDWAAAEGWNPGIDDAEAFHGIDPAGFLMGWLGAEPATAISVVRHSDDFGFLGFYLCRPDLRGQGHGWATWQAGMAHLGARVVGLDGVPDQEENYRTSGFALAHRAHRFVGPVDGRAHAGITIASLSDMADILTLDLGISGTPRTAYLSTWVQPTASRQTMLLRRDGAIAALGTIRACRDGHKIGPLFATTSQDALALIESLVDAVGARNIAIDVPEPNGPARALAESLGLVPVFACARMYRGAALARDLSRIWGETTFELG